MHWSTKLKKQKRFRILFVERLFFIGVAVLSVIVSWQLAAWLS